MTNGSEQRKSIFDRWAADYDRSVNELARAGSFPFDGYDRVLDRVCRELDAAPGLSVLDLGTGTGNLARRVLDLGGRVWGIDFSALMLEKARSRVPEACLVEADLRATWPESVDGPFDRIASTYVLHEFDLPTKVAILGQAARRLAPAGRIVVGDIAFATHDDLAAAQRRWHDGWDHDEHYWVAADAVQAVSDAGLRGRWIAVSDCAGVLVFEPAPDSDRGGS